jgi:hypothetical protein
VIICLGSSGVLRVLLRQAHAWAGWGRWERAYASEILEVEARRVLDRLRLGSLLDDRGIAQAHQRERRNLAAVFVTHDDRQATAARALGFDVVGV